MCPTDYRDRDRDRDREDRDRVHVTLFKQLRVAIWALWGFVWPCSPGNAAMSCQTFGVKTMLTWREDDVLKRISSMVEHQNFMANGTLLIFKFGCMLLNLEVHNCFVS